MIFRPYKSDIRQIESLVKLGCNRDDIAMVLSITPAKLQKWEASHIAIAEMMKPKALPEYTCTHPDFAPQVEEAFTCGGKRFFRFKEDYRMPAGRYKYYYSTLKELELKLSIKDLEKFIEVFETVVNGGNKSKDIKIMDICKMILNLKSRVNLAFDVSTVKKLAAVSYFDETEDLTTFDEKYGEEKIKLWEGHEVHDFFLTRRIAELLKVKPYSIELFEEHLKETEETKKALDFDMLQVLEANL